MMRAATTANWGRRATNGSQSSTPSLWTGLQAAWLPSVGRGRRLPSVGGAWKGEIVAVGSAAAVGPGRFGTELQFAGSNGQWSATNTAHALGFIHQTAVFSVSVLARLQTINVGQVLVDSINGAGSNKGFYLYVSGVNKLECYVSRGGAAVCNYTSTRALAANTWYLLTAACNGTTCRAWIGGELDTATASIGTLGTGDATSDLSIGTGTAGNNYQLTGSIAGIWIWNRCLAAREIVALSTDPRSFLQSPTFNLGFAINTASYSALGSVAAATAERAQLFVPGTRRGGALSSGSIISQTR